ncbi:paeninodin family lasso peptide [Metabacillus litoralis]|uniref:Paeninodin family lasso peptide n=1 Tax=Metabacillus litoralis TaxID=152268 RepID=A0A5C6W904_9BACI|nr:paeninodin family lasso peptide [Metabacillus litoralis]TXC92354.1 paeninodin family lasso peptide [Metabacillus litoralis]
MKKQWTNPTLEALDVKNTMWNLIGNNHDGAWTENISNLVENGDGLSEAQMS